MSPAYPAFSLLPCPLSPSPFPNGEGEIYGYFMQGAPPLASPAFNRLRHLQSLPYRYPHGVAGFFNPDSRHPTGTNSPEKQGTRPLRASPTFGKPVPPGFSPRGCKGRSPLHKKAKNLPLPRRGRALCERGRGMGAGKQAKGTVGRQQTRQAPRRGRQGQVEPSARRQMRKLSKQPQQQHLELQLL